MAAIVIFPQSDEDIELEARQFCEEMLEQSRQRMIAEMNSWAPGIKPIIDPTKFKQLQDEIEADQINDG